MNYRKLLKYAPLFAYYFEAEVGRGVFAWLFNQVILCSGTTITTLVQATKHAQRTLATRHLQNIYIHRRRNRWGRSGHGLTIFLTCYYEAKPRVRRVISLSHPLLVYVIRRTCAIAIGTPWSVYCRASSEMSDRAVAVHPNTQHSKVTHSLHKHLAWPLQFCFLRLWYIYLCKKLGVEEEGRAFGQFSGAYVTYIAYFTCTALDDMIKHLAVEWYEVLIDWFHTYYWLCAHAPIPEMGGWGHVIVTINWHSKVKSVDASCMYIYGLSHDGRVGFLQSWRCPLVTHLTLKWQLASLACQESYNN